MANQFQPNLGQQIAYKVAQGSGRAMNFMAPALGPLGYGMGALMQHQLHPQLPTPASDSQDVRNPFVNQIANASPEMYAQNIPLHVAPTQSVLGEAIQPVRQAIQAVVQPKQPAAASENSTDQIAQQIQQGFTKWGGSNVPAATLSASFARAGQGLPDPLMPAVLALKETGGGKHLADKNNLLNIQYGGIGNSPYEKPEYSIEGGGGHGGFPKVINSGMYNDYLKSGNLEDFFKVYTPHTDKSGKVINGSYADQIKAYNQLRSYFTP